MVGYVRQDTTNQIADGNIIGSQPLNDEYNALENAFNASTGHSHDGGVGEGAPITRVGPAQDLVVSINNAVPKTHNALDLGTNLTRFKDLYLQGNLTAAGALNVGSISLTADLAIDHGGTGASNAADARTNLGLAIGTDVQAFDAGLLSIAGLTTTADTMIYTTAADTYATTVLTSFGRNLLDDADAAAGRTTLGLGTIATQNSDAVAITGGTISGITSFASGNVTITGGTITGITDLAVADGGTGASNASDARTNLGLGTVSTQDSSSINITGGTITGITDLAIADGGTGASNVADARTNLGLGSIATQNSDNVGITGGTIAGITDLAIADGGTGASTEADARTNLGLGTMSTQDATAVNIDGGTIDNTTLTGNTITGGSISGITDLAIADGGTGASTVPAARANLLVDRRLVTNTTSTYNSTLADRNIHLRCTTVNQTVNLTAQSTLGTDWVMDIEAVEVTVTLDAAGADTINGAATYVIFPGEVTTLIATTGGFIAHTPRFGRRTDISVSNVASLTYDIPADVTRFRISVARFDPVASGGFLFLQIGTGGSGGTFLGGTSDYYQNIITQVEGVVSGVAGDVDRISITQAQSNTAPRVNYGWSETLCQDFNTANGRPSFIGTRGGVSTPSENGSTTFATRLNASTDNFNAFRMQSTGGNIAELEARIDWDA